MTIREIGVSHASGLTTYFSLDQSRTLSYYRRQGSKLDHKEIDDEIRARIAARDDRMFVAIIEGNVDFMLTYKRRLSQPNVIIFVSNVENLRLIGVTAIDELWKKGDTQLDLNEFLLR